jgi:predicted RNase H-like HicB family nuclease
MPRLSLEDMLGLAWTWRGPTRIADENGEHYEMRIAELPDFFLAGESPEEVLRELRAALAAFLRSYTERGEDPPLPPTDRWQIGDVSELTLPLVENGR